MLGFIVTSENQEAEVLNAFIFFTAFRLIGIKGPCRHLTTFRFAE